MHGIIQFRAEIKGERWGGVGRARMNERGREEDDDPWMAVRPQAQVWWLCYWALAGKGLQALVMTDMPSGALTFLLPFKVACDLMGWAPRQEGWHIISLPFICFALKVIGVDMLLFSI